MSRKREREEFNPQWYTKSIRVATIFFFWDGKIVEITVKVAMSHSTWKMDRF